MAHIINLAAQKILSTMAADAVEEEIDLANAEEWEEEELSPGAVLKKVRRVVAKVRASTKLWEALEQEIQVVGLRHNRPILDMRIRYAHFL